MFYIFASLPKAWSGGRVARQWSAKPRTAVQIRSRPQISQLHDRSWLFFMHFLNITLLYIYIKKNAGRKKIRPAKKPS